MNPLYRFTCHGWVTQTPTDSTPLAPAQPSSNGQAVEHHRKKVRFFATVDLVNALEQEKALNKAGQLAERLLRLDLIILDELG